MNIDLKPIAESKVRQLAGDVCGVLVRNESGTIMAVSEDGRCTRLDAGVMGPTTNAPASVRDEFERWYSQEGEYGGLPLDRFEKDGDYLDDFVQSMWMAWQAARAQGGQGSEPVGFIPASGLNNLAAGHPAKIYPVEAMPSPFESHALVYTHPPAKPESVPEVATEGMLSEGVESLVRGLKAFPDNYTQIVSNIWEDMVSTAPQADGWVKCGERLPTEADADFEYRLWCWLPERNDMKLLLLDQVIQAHLSGLPVLWMPTGLKRPQPPKQEGEGDE